MFRKKKDVKVKIKQEVTNAKGIYSDVARICRGIALLHPHVDFEFDITLKEPDAESEVTHEAD